MNWTDPQRRTLDRIAITTERLEALDSERARRLDQLADGFVDAIRFGVPITAVADAARLPVTTVRARLAKRQNLPGAN